MPPIVLARVPRGNPRPGYTLPQLLTALAELPQGRDGYRPPDSLTQVPALGLRLLVRIEGSYAELPILAITESAAPDGATLVLLASEPPPP